MIILNLIVSAREEIDNIVNSILKNNFALNVVVGDAIDSFHLNSLGVKMHSVVYPIQFATKSLLFEVSPLTKRETTVSLPDEKTTEEGGRFTPDAILFATNHFEKNTEFLSPIVDIAKLFSSTVHVSVFVDTDFAEAYDYIYNVRELNRYIGFLKTTYSDVAFKGELLEGKDLESTLEKYNDEKGIDIIAMITYPKSFWGRLMKKSVTKEVAFNSKTPVLAIPAK